MKTILVFDDSEADNARLSAMAIETACKLFELSELLRTINKRELTDGEDRLLSEIRQAFGEWFEEELNLLH